MSEATPPAARTAPSPDFAPDDVSLDDFCMLILSHGRAGDIPTLASLERHGYTGDWYIVIDHPDDYEPYTEEYGEERVVYFEKDDVIPGLDRGDNFDRRNSILYARHHSFEIARDLGYDYFMQLDDDFNYFQRRFTGEYEYGYESGCGVESMDTYVRHAITFLERAGLDTVCMAQGGDFIGGAESHFAEKVRTKRKAMNTFLCNTDRPFAFRGSINEDVNTYTRAQQLGKLFLTVNFVSVDQEDTQQAEGGLTDLYRAQGTYIKSFYTVLYCPASVTLAEITDRTEPRIHHRVDWRRTVPKIVPERVKADSKTADADVEESA